MKKWIAVCALALAACANQTPTATGSREVPSAQHEQAKAVFDQALAAYNAQDYAAALPLFRQAAAQGFFKADRYIGLAYLNGYGVAKDPAQAFAAFSRASGKDITGQYWLGYCYENGIGTAKDMRQAVYWYQKSAQRGDHVSQPAIDALQRLGIAVVKQ
ncbi:tetratricopeptide repeat protein [Neisseria dentiae]|uniref:tetratricopeptide repeat protein n=1 Tax=Neisseria dentiae TaxID=194197 RepID=UPI0035A0C6E7